MRSSAGRRTSRASESSWPGTSLTSSAWAAGLAEARGADFVDLNLGCPIDRFTRIGLGASLGRQPNRVRRLVEAMKAGVTRVPITVKIRLGWNDDDRNYLDVARAAVDGGAAAIAVHGRTRDARYRFAADWEAIGEGRRGRCPVPVIGNGDILFPHEAAAAREALGLRGRDGRARRADQAVDLPRGGRGLSGRVGRRAPDYLSPLRRAARSLTGGTTTAGAGRSPSSSTWHAGFWCRYAPRRPDGSWPAMQERESLTFARSPLEALLARQDDEAHAWIVERLMAGDGIDPRPRHRRPREGGRSRRQRPRADPSCHRSTVTRPQRGQCPAVRFTKSGIDANGALSRSPHRARGRRPVGAGRAATSASPAALRSKSSSNACPITLQLQLHLRRPDGQDRSEASSQRCRIVPGCLQRRLAGRVDLCEQGLVASKSSTRASRVERRPWRGCRVAPSRPSVTLTKRETAIRARGGTRARRRRRRGRRDRSEGLRQRQRRKAAASSSASSKGGPPL